ncbi:hypothetical protein Bca52824_065174 [Brassica carinata]|uniref:Replication protein A 70 kDa DNA-binding subunit B/D first OB fold domain-containing protein n=1 Tax=Brassica carinata TaxID=52824 RepID=A0A8X7QHT2_BRACI|nr:hypothetical protein Bca52824_065174 [Brassica carinata]
MSSIMQVTSLKDVKPFKSGWKVHVKVLHTWKQYNAVHGDTLEIVLSDDNSVLSGSLNPNFLIDVIGQVMELGDLETIQVVGKPRRKVEFTLRDINDSSVPCCLWGKISEVLYEGCSKEEEGKPICLIRFAKIGRYRGELQITNAFEASQLLINPSIPETDAFKQIKEAWNDPPADLTSHTKKLCSKAIKVEKMNDLEAEANKNT